MAWPLFNGSTTETNLPIRWSKTENVAWKTPLPGRSGATPIVWRDSVFLPSPDEEKKLRLFCIDMNTGDVRWQKIVGVGDRETGKNNMASCSAVTDGKHVFALFGTGDMAAFDFAGNKVWQRRLPEEFGAFAVMFQYGASPLLWNGTLYVLLLQRNAPVYGHARDGRPERRSWLICLDPDSGKTLWRHERVTGAREEAMEAYTTPLPFSGPQGVSLILAERTQ